MIVVDINVIAYLFIDSDNSIYARKLFEQNPDWAAPILWKSEFRSILTKYIRHNLLELEDALLLMKNAQSLMRGNEYEVVSQDILKLTNQSKCSAYDCEYISLAQNLNSNLYTSDKQVLREFPDISISLKTI